MKIWNFLKSHDRALFAGILLSVFLLGCSGGGGGGSAGGVAPPPPPPKTIGGGLYTCSDGAGIVGCWSDSACYAFGGSSWGKISLSFRSDGTYLSVVDMYNESTCGSSIGSYLASTAGYAVGSPVTTVFGSPGTELDMSILGTGTMSYTSFEIAGSYICFPYGDYGVNPSFIGLQLDDPLIANRSLDIDYLTCLKAI